MEKKKHRSKKHWFWVVLVLILMGGVVWFYRSNLLTGEIKYAVAQTGTITHERKVPALFANQELPVVAPYSGTIQFVGNDGQRFRRGETLATLQQNGAALGAKQDSTTKTVINAAAGGIFFYQSDGLETIMTSENLMSMDLGKLVAQTSNAKTTGQTVQAGEIVGKIVNNLMPSMAFLQLQSIDDLIVGKTIRLTTGNQTINAKIMRKSEKPMGVVVQFPQYINGSASDRHQEVIWNYAPQTSGILVPKSALWTQGEETGVFVSTEGVVHFKKVKVLDENDQQVCVDNIMSGIPLIINPRAGLEGLIAKVKNI
jgi:putative membrane fusion protein